jgi:ABC-2 type transport system permease protein
VKTLHPLARYFRIYLALVRSSLSAELSYRGNFLAKLVVEVLWLAVVLLFFRELYARTDSIAGWDRYQFLFFLGCHLALSGVMETFFLDNCVEFAELVRSGDLDFALLKPIDEQFLLGSRKMGWSAAPNILHGSIIMAAALAWQGWVFDPLALVIFLLLFACGVALTGSFLLLLASTSVWFVRNQHLVELWWLFTTLMRYPRQIFDRVWWAEPLGRLFTLIIPVLLVVSVPAETLVRRIEPWTVLWMLLLTVVFVVASRRFFYRALRSYRSASS